MKILVLDDHAAFRDEVVSILARNGHEASGAETATAAIPMVESGNYDFVLVDYNMPEHDGIWFMQHVKRPKRTKALLITAHMNPQVIIAMARAGISGYIIKPFDEDDLLRHLAFHAGHGKSSPETECSSRESTGKPAAP